MLFFNHFLYIPCCFQRVGKSMIFKIDGIKRWTFFPLTRLGSYVNTTLFSVSLLLHLTLPVFWRTWGTEESGWIALLVALRAK